MNLKIDPFKNGMVKMHKKKSLHIKKNMNIIFHDHSTDNIKTIYFHYAIAIFDFSKNKFYNFLSLPSNYFTFYIYF